ncbi:uncharacterized protein TNCV_3075361 [Trichonephila clavipes]|nr:uncharacterized protein TNCV_3075361 [Trichonephila clavipes]
MLTVNVDQVRIYRHRKCDDMEIRTGSSDSNSSRQESSSFDRVQRRSNESQYGRKKGSDVKRKLEEKRISFKKDQVGRHTNKTNKRGPIIRSTPSSWSETSKRIKINNNQKIGYKRSRESGSGEPERKIRKGSDHRVPKRALSPRGERGVESRPAMEMKTQQTEQGGPVRARKSKGRNYNRYIEERTRSDNRNARRRGDQNGRTKKGRERVLADQYL